MRAVEHRLLHSHIIWWCPKPYFVSQVTVYYDVSGVPATGASTAASALGSSSTLSAFLQQLQRSGKGHCHRDLPLPCWGVTTACLHVSFMGSVQTRNFVPFKIQPAN